MEKFGCVSFVTCIAFLLFVQSAVSVCTTGISLEDDGVLITYNGASPATVGDRTHMLIGEAFWVLGLYDEAPLTHPPLATGQCIAIAAVQMSREFGGWNDMVVSDLRGVPIEAFRKALDEVGFDDHDGRNCSVFVATVLRFTEVDTDFPKHTANQYRRLSTSGLFDNVTCHVAGDMGNLLPGDILIRPSHHVAIYVGNGRVAQAFLNTRQAGPLAAFVGPITSTFTTSGERITDRSNTGMAYEIFRLRK